MSDEHNRGACQRSFQRTPPEWTCLDSSQAEGASFSQHRSHPGPIRCHKERSDHQWGITGTLQNAKLVAMFNPAHLLFQRSVREVNKQLKMWDRMKATEVWQRALCTPHHPFKSLPDLTPWVPLNRLYDWTDRCERTQEGSGSEASGHWVGHSHDREAKGWRGRSVMTWVLKPTVHHHQPELVTARPTRKIPLTKKSMLAGHSAADLPRHKLLTTERTFQRPCLATLHGRLRLQATQKTSPQEKSAGSLLSCVVTFEEQTRQPDPFNRLHSCKSQLRRCEA